MRNRLSRRIAPGLVALALLLASCSGSGSRKNGQTAHPLPVTGATAALTPSVQPGEQVTPIEGQKIGGTVRVLAVWSGVELDNFYAVVKPFEDRTGIQVQVETARDLVAELNSRVSAGNPPDLAGIPTPGTLATFAGSGALKPLDSVLDMNEMKQQYAPGLLQLGSVNGKQYGIFTKAAVKSLVWYDPKAFAVKGYNVPRTWQDLQTLQQQMQKDGATPWCIGVNGGAGSGWPGTDWVEDLLLHQSGPDVYDRWITHQISWTDPAVKQAWQTWGAIVNDPKMVYGGPAGAAAASFYRAFNPMFATPPGCYLYKQADFITSFFIQQFPNLKAGTDYNFFVLPSPDPQYQNILEVGGDLFGMFRDTPQARALIQYLTTPGAQSIWAARGGYLAPNKLVNPTVYPDDLTRSIYKLYTSVSSVRFDASDQMLPAIAAAFSQGVLQYPGHPDQLDTILGNIEAQSQGSFSK